MRTGIDTSESGGWEAEGREGSKGEPPYRDGRLVPWRILAAHPFRRSVVARALLLQRPKMRPGTKTSLDGLRREQYPAFPIVDGERERGEGLLALARAEKSKSNQQAFSY